MIMGKLKLAILLCLASLYSNESFGFPDTIRHGYTNCTTCHVSPSGGGVLNGYGRSLSRELLSSFGYKDEEQPLHGLVKVPESAYQYFAVGGDSRYLLRQSERSGVKVKEDFLMQQQFRFAAFLGNLKFFMNLGKIENPRESSRVKFESTEYYVLWSPKEEVYVRAGRFEPIYGLRMPDHNLWVKSELGFLPWIERDSVEFIFEGETQFASLAGFQSSSAMDSRQQKTGYSASFYQILWEKSRLGVSAKNGEGQGSRARSVSVHSTISFSEKTYLLSEYSGVSENGNKKEVGFTRFGVEVLKGFTPFLQAQSKIDKTGSGGDQFKYGYGVIWLPRPHLEIQATFEQASAKSGNSNEGLLLLHYYL